MRVRAECTAVSTPRQLYVAGGEQDCARGVSQDASLNLSQRTTQMYDPSTYRVTRSRLRVPNSLCYAYNAHRH